MPLPIAPASAYKISLWEQMAIAAGIPDASITIAYVRMLKDATLAIVWGSTPPGLNWNPNEQVSSQQLSEGEQHILPFELAKRMARDGLVQRVDRLGRPYTIDE